MYTLRRDSDTCSQCGECDKVFKGLSAMKQINIRMADFDREHIYKAVKLIIALCPESSLSLIGPD